MASFVENINKLADISSDIETLSPNISSIVIVANDLNEDISEIETVANNISVIDIIGSDLQNSCAEDVQDNGSVSDSVTAGNCTGGILQTVYDNINEIVYVANNDNINVVGENISSVNTVSSNISSVNTVSTNISSVNNVLNDIDYIIELSNVSDEISIVSDNIDSVIIVKDNIDNVNTTADNISDIQLASTNIADIQAVADEVAKVVVVANDLNEAVSEIETVANNIDSVNTVGLNIDSVNTVSTNIASVNTVAGISSDITFLATNWSDKVDTTDIGVTVQAYNANTVIDSSYVHTDNNFTSTLKSKLDGIASGAEVNVNADWNATSGDAQILNKPTLGTASAQNVSYFATAAQGTKADTALQPASIGVTVQGYNANTVVDSSYVHTDNNYTTTEKTKLSGIESGATADQTADEIITLLNNDTTWTLDLGSLS